MRVCTQPLILASFENRTSVLELLVSAGANVQLQQQHGLTALHAAAQHGNAPVVRMMLAADAQVDARHQPSGLTALMLAAQHGHAAVVKLLLEAGADRRLQDKAGDTAMVMAAARATKDGGQGGNDWADVVRLLQEEDEVPR